MRCLPTVSYTCTGSDDRGTSGAVSIFRVVLFLTLDRYQNILHGEQVFELQLRHLK